MNVGGVKAHLRRIIQLETTKQQAPMSEIPCTRDTNSFQQSNVGRVVLSAKETLLLFEERQRRRS